MPAHSGAQRARSIVSPPRWGVPFPRRRTALDDTLILPSQRRHVVPRARLRLVGKAGDRPHAWLPALTGLMALAICALGMAMSC